MTYKDYKNLYRFHMAIYRKTGESEHKRSAYSARGRMAAITRKRRKEAKEA